MHPCSHIFTLAHRALSFQVQNVSDIDRDGYADILSRFYDDDAGQYGMHIAYGNSR